MEIRCEWDDRYPPESCPTRVLHQFTLERMDKTDHCYANRNVGKQKTRKLTEKQLIKKKLAAERKAGIIG